MQISVLIVNYNTQALVCTCVKTLLQQKSVSFEIIVVDNASNDGSVAALESQFGAQIKLIKSAENLGFGRANNLAASHAAGEFYYLLNPDARLKGDYALRDLYQFMQAYPQYGAVGTAIYEPRKKRWIKPRYQYPGEQHLKHTQKLKGLPGRISWVLGASMIVPRKIYQQVQGFDADFFVYGEETDLCLRIREAGFEIGYCDTVQVEHVGGASELHLPSQETWTRKQKGHYRFCHKHYDARDVQRLAKLAIRRGRRKHWLLKLQQFLGKKNHDKLARVQASVNTAKEQLEHN